MKFDFDKINNRRGSGSLKWDVLETETPMWVADMDFKTAPAVIEALEKKVQSGIFGYHIVPDEWYQAIQLWWEKRHHFQIEKDWLCFCTGVVPAITSAVKRITNVGDNVLVQTPVYDIFFHSIENTGRHVLESPLTWDGKGYEINFEALEENLSHPLTTMMILCNPHNPAGKLWTREELKKIGELCKKHGVTVLSDEIHCDLTAPGSEYVPFASVSEVCAKISMTCISASKAFNIAGLQSAAVVIPEAGLQNKIVRGLNSDEVAEPNAFAIDAVVAAFTQGEEWLDELREYLFENKKLVQEFIQNEIPVLYVLESDATYLIWIDCSRLNGDASEFGAFLREHTGLYLSTGSQYRGNGRDFLRMNVACPRSQVEKGLALLKQGVAEFGQ